MQRDLNLETARELRTEELGLVVGGAGVPRGREFPLMDGEVPGQELYPQPIRK
jgi:hypothetical protein